MTINFIMDTISPNPSANNRTKLAINTNRPGTVFEKNGIVYVNFTYLGHRVRESAGIPWNVKNTKHVREQLDRIFFAINDGSFRFTNVFPNSKKADFFTEIERNRYNLTMRPDEVKIGPYCDLWYQRLKATGRVRERTLLGYKSHLDHYLKPYFGDKYFSWVSLATVDDFAIWAKHLELRGKPVSNKSINKCLVPFKIICKQAAIEYRWGADFNPFFGYKNLPENDSAYQIKPFSVDEQQRIIEEMSEHWKPYFQIAFGLGLRQGEQLALQPGDIDFSRAIMTIDKAMTLDESGKRIEGATKNKYSQREIDLFPTMVLALETQVSICNQLGGDYLFCSETGCMINHANLSNRVWQPALQRAGIPYRPMAQTRHSFATTALSLGENPLWISSVMGHRDTDMILRVYTKFVKNAVHQNDGRALNNLHEQLMSNC